MKSTIQIVNEVVARICVNKHKVDRPKVVLLMGLQYSGKSYLAEQIANKNYCHFWATKVKKEYGIANDAMFEIATLVLKKAVSDGYNIVIDYVNHKYEIRKNFQAEAESLNGGYEVVFLNIPSEERLRRREENVKQGDLPGRRVISVEDMQKFENEFELPHEDEPAVELSTQTEIDRYIESL